MNNKKQKHVDADSLMCIEAHCGLHQCKLNDTEKKILSPQATRKNMYVKCEKTTRQNQKSYPRKIN